MVYGNDHEITQKILDRFNRNFAQSWLINPGVSYSSSTADYFLNNYIIITMESNQLLSLYIVKQLKFYYTFLLN